MSMVAIRAGLEKALGAMTPPLSTAFENEAFEPTAGVANQAVHILPARPINDEMSASHMEQGFMQVTLRYPANQGWGAATARAEAIRTAFPRGRTIVEAAVNTTIEFTPEILPAYVEADRFCIPVRVHFYTPITA